MPLSYAGPDKSEGEIRAQATDAYKATYEIEMNERHRRAVDILLEDDAYGYIETLPPDQFAVISDVLAYAEHMEDPQAAQHTLSALSRFELLQQAQERAVSKIIDRHKDDYPFPVDDRRRIRLEQLADQETPLNITPGDVVAMYRLEQGIIDKNSTAQRHGLWKEIRRRNPQILSVMRTNKQFDAMLDGPSLYDQALPLRTEAVETIIREHESTDRPTAEPDSPVAGSPEPSSDEAPEVLDGEIMEQPAGPKSSDGGEVVDADVIEGPEGHPAPPEPPAEPVDVKLIRPDAPTAERPAERPHYVPPASSGPRDAEELAVAEAAWRATKAERAEAETRVEAEAADEALRLQVQRDADQQAAPPPEQLTKLDRFFIGIDRFFSSETYSWGSPKTAARRGARFTRNRPRIKASRLPSVGPYLGRLADRVKGFVEGQMQQRQGNAEEGLEEMKSARLALQADNDAREAAEALVDSDKATADRISELQLLREKLRGSGLIDDVIIFGRLGISIERLQKLGKQGYDNLKNHIEISGANISRATRPMATVTLEKCIVARPENAKLPMVISTMELAQQKLYPEYYLYVGGSRLHLSEQFSVDPELLQSYKGGNSLLLKNTEAAALLYAPGPAGKPGTVRTILKSAEGWKQLKLLTNGQVELEEVPGGLSPIIDAISEMTGGVLPKANHLHLDAFLSLPHMTARQLADAQQAGAPEPPPPDPGRLNVKGVRPWER